MESKSIDRQTKLIAVILAMIMVATTLLPANWIGIPNTAYAQGSDTTYPGTEINAALKKLAYNTEHPKVSYVIDERTQVMMADEEIVEDTALEVIEEPSAEVVVEEPVTTEPDTTVYTEPVTETQPATEAINYEMVNYVQGLISALPLAYTADTYTNAPVLFQDVESAYSGLSPQESALVDLSNYYASQNAYSAFVQAMSEQETTTQQETQTEPQTEAVTTPEQEQTTTPEETTAEDVTAEEEVFDENTIDTYIQAITWSNTAPSDGKKTVSLSYNGKLVAWYESATTQKERDQAAGTDWFTAYDENGNTYTIYKEYKNTVYLYYYAENADDHIYFNADLSHAFQNLQNLTDISGLKYIRTDYVQNMSYLFAGDKYLTDISAMQAFNTQSLTNAAYMFSGCENLVNVDSFLNEHIYDLKADEERSGYDRYMRLVSAYTVAKVTAPYNPDATYEYLSDEEKTWYPAPYSAWVLNTVYAEGAFSGTKVETYPDWYFNYMGWALPAEEPVTYQVRTSVQGSGSLVITDEEGTPSGQELFYEGDRVVVSVLPDENSHIEYVDVFDRNGSVNYEVLSNTAIAFPMPASVVDVKASFAENEVQEPESIPEETQEAPEPETEPVSQEETTEPEDIELNPYEVEGFNETALERIDFSTMRLIVVTADPEIIADHGVVISNRDDVYLLQFEDVETTKEAYKYYATYADIVESDSASVTIDSEDTADHDAADTENAPMTEQENPITELENTISEEATNQKYDIALIDTGASVGQNVKSSVSVIGESGEDDNGHGTDMVKFITEQNPDASILSIKAMDSKGVSTFSGLYAAFEYALSQDVKIINVSASAFSTETNSIIAEEVRKANDAGIIVVGSAGNMGRNVKYYILGNIEEAVIIGACNEEGDILEISNFGDTVDYNVVANSTSEAAAKFTGWISANGLDAVEAALGQGLIYAADYNADAPITDNEILNQFRAMLNIDTTKDEIVSFVSALTVPQAQALYAALTNDEFGMIMNIFHQASGRELTYENGEIAKKEIMDLFHVNIFTVNSATGGHVVIVDGSKSGETPIYQFNGHQFGGVDSGVDQNNNAWLRSIPYGVVTDTGSFNAYCVQALQGYPVGTYATGITQMDKNDPVTKTLIKLYLVSPYGPLYEQYRSKLFDNMLAYFKYNGCFGASGEDASTLDAYAEYCMTHMMMSGVYSGEWSATSGAYVTFNSYEIGLFQQAIEWVKSTVSESSTEFQKAVGYVVKNPAGTQDVFWIEFPKNTSMSFEKIVDNNTGSLKITKNADAKSDPNKNFTFTLEVFNASGNRVTTSFSYSGSKSGTISGNRGTVTLQKGQSITVSGIPAGSTYTVTETGDPGYKSYTKVNGGTQTVGNVASGSIPSAPGSDEFVYTVTFSDGQSHSYTGSKSGSIASGGTITLRGGQKVTIDGLPIGTTYSVVESAKSGYTQSHKLDSGSYTSGGSFSNVSASGVHNLTFRNTYSPAQQSVEFYNERQVGDLKLSKTTENKSGVIELSKITNGDGVQYDQDHQFEFTVQIKDAAGNISNANYNYSGSISGTVNGNNGKIYLKGGQKVTITGVPLGASYTISEKEEQYYDTYNYKNNGAKTAGLTVRDSISVAPPANQEFTFKVTFSDGGTYSYTGSKTGNIRSGNTITLSSGQSITIKDVPIDIKYTITETIPTVTGGTYSTSDVPKTGNVSTSGTTLAVKNTFTPTAKSVKFENTVKPAYVYLEKESKYPYVTNNDSHYSLKGAVFGVYRTESDALYRQNEEFSLTTDANGKTETHRLTPWTTHYVREITASPGYKVNQDIYKIYVLPGDTTHVEKDMQDNDFEKIPETPYLKTKISIEKVSEGNHEPLSTAEFTLYIRSYKNGQTFIEYPVVLSNVDGTGMENPGYYTFYNEEENSWFLYETDDNPYGEFVLDETKQPENHVSTQAGTSLATGNPVAWTSGIKKISEYAVIESDDPGYMPRPFIFDDEVTNVPTSIPVRLYKHCSTTPDVFLKECTFVLYEWDNTLLDYDTEHPIPMTWVDDPDDSTYGGYYEATVDFDATNGGKFKWEELESQEGYVLSNPSWGKFTLSLSDFSNPLYVIKKPLNNEESTYTGTIKLLKEKSDSVGITKIPYNTDAEFKVFEWNPKTNAYDKYVQTLVYKNGYYQSPAKLTAYINPNSTMYNGGKFKVIETKAPTGLLIGDGWSKEFQILPRESLQEFSGVEWTVQNKVNEFNLTKLIEGTNIELNGVTFEISNGTNTIAITTGTSINNPIRSSLGFGYTVNGGKIHLEEIPAGNYTIRETAAPDNYLLDRTLYSFTVDSNGKISVGGVKQDSYSLTVTNANAIQLRVTKTEPAATRNTTNRSADVAGFPAGTEFTVYEFDQTANAYKTEAYAVMRYDGTNFVDTVTNTYVQLARTQANDGKFKIVETASTDGYILDTSVYEIQYAAKADQSIGYKVWKDGTLIQDATYANYVSVAFENTPNMLKLKKVDERGEPLGGATFKISGPSGDLTLTSDANGICTAYRLAPGDYRVVEIQAPTGFIADKSIILFTVDEDNKIVLSDSVKLIPPDTAPTIQMTNTKSQKLRITKTDTTHGNYYETNTGFPRGTEFALYEWSQNLNDWVYITNVIHKEDYAATH